MAKDIGSSHLWTVQLKGTVTGKWRLFPLLVYSVRQQARNVAKQFREKYNFKTRVRPLVSL